MFGLNEEQMDILAKWYNMNCEKANNLFFNCSRDMDRGTLTEILRINYFDAINMAVNDFVVNVLAKGK
jgi:hypothetical protein